MISRRRIIGLGLLTSGTCAKRFACRHSWRHEMPKRSDFDGTLCADGIAFGPIGAVPSWLITVRVAGIRALLASVSIARWPRLFGCCHAAFVQSRVLNHRRLLVHRLDLLCQPGGHNCPCAIRHFCRDPRVRCSGLHCGAVRWRHRRNLRLPIVAGRATGPHTTVAVASGIIRAIDLGE